MMATTKNPPTKKTPTKNTPTKKSPTKKNPTKNIPSKNTSVSSSSSETNKTVTEYAPYQNPSSVSFDSDAWKQAYIDQMVSELTSNYNTDKANLDKTYNTNITNYNNQLNDTNMSYDANIQALQRQKYDDVQQAKNESFSRGLGFGGLGQAIEQTARNNANNKIADTQNERTMAINNINTLINQAKYNYGVDSDTLLKNFNADKLKYMSTAEIQALEKKLQVDMYNNDWSNKFLQDANNRTFTSSENDKKYDWQGKENALNRDFEASEAQKNRDAQTALAKLQAKLYGSGKSGGGSYGGYGSRYPSGSSGNSQVQRENDAANYLSNIGVPSDADGAYQLYTDYAHGTIDWATFKSKADAIAKSLNPSSKSSGSSSKSTLNLTPLGKLLGGWNLNLNPLNLNPNIRTGFGGTSPKTGKTGATDGHTTKKGGHR